MKKLALVLVMVFCTGVLMAQHIDIVTQTGLFNNSLVTQEFNGSGLTLDGNEAYVLQAGVANLNVVYQDNNGYAGSAEFAFVTQLGNFNIAGINQTNDGHFGLIYSQGDFNQAYILQRYNKNDGFIRQIGDWNLGTIVTWGGDNYSEIFQLGVGNISTQLIGTEGAGVNTSLLFASQDGFFNTAFQEIEGDGFPGGIVNENNEGYIFQLGFNNDGIQLMHNGFGEVDNNYSFLLQAGSDNTSYQYQRGDGNSSTHFQFGNNNTETTLQNW